MKEFTPFGISYANKTVRIKLRFKSKPFFETNMKKYGSYKTTQTGYIIFEAELDAGSYEWVEFKEARSYYNRIAAM